MQARKGFTLIELLICISIIAVLIAIILPTLAHVREQAKNTECKSNLKNMVFLLNEHCDYYLNEKYPLLPDPTLEFMKCPSYEDDGSRVLAKDRIVEGCYFYYPFPQKPIWTYDAQQLIFSDHKPRHFDGYNLVFGDGAIERREGDWDTNWKKPF